jgi:hypothetical protein
MTWRAAPDRLAAYKRVRRFWSELGYPVLTADSAASKPFNLSQARNRAVDQVKTEFVIIADADTLGNPAVIRKALLTCGGEMVWPFDDYRSIDLEWLDSPLDELWGKPRVGYLQEDGWPIWGPAGLMVCRVETYWRLGGFDERFTTWGREDTAFLCAASTLTGARALPGVAVSFDHARPRDLSRCNNALYDIYKAADGDPEAMEALVADRARGVDTWRSHWASPSPGVHWVGPPLEALFG